MDCLSHVLRQVNMDVPRYMCLYAKGSLYVINNQSFMQVDPLTQLW